MGGSDSSVLWDLIGRRAQAGTDVVEIDREIWDRFGGRHAVMFTDLSGFSRQVARFGILHFLQIIHQQRRLLFPVIDEHAGTLLKEEGDSLLVLFSDVARAFDCATAMQRATVAFNQGRPPEEHVLLCLGIGWGDVLRVGDEDVWGREVNSASKLGEDTARAGEILLTAAAREALGDPPGVTFEEIGHGFTPDDRNYRARLAGQESPSPPRDHA